MPDIVTSFEIMVCTFAQTRPGVPGAARSQSVLSLKARELGKFYGLQPVLAYNQLFYDLCCMHTHH
jgi:hypothetical protein